MDNKIEKWTLGVDIDNSDTKFTDLSICMTFISLGSLPILRSLNISVYRLPYFISHHKFNDYFPKHPGF